MKEVPSPQETQIPAARTSGAPKGTTRRARVVAWILFLVAVLTGLLLRTAYEPSGGQNGVIWLAPVPFFLAVRLLPPKRAAQLAFVGAFAFWASLLTWFWPLTDNGGPWPLVVLGEIGLSAYCSLFPALCAAALSRLHAPWRALREESRDWYARRIAALPDSPEEEEADRQLKRLAKKSLWLEIASPLAACLLWSGSEYLRANFGGGFSWYTLGSALIDFHPLAHWAAWGGIYLVSAFVVVLADALAGVLLRTVDTIRHTPGSTRRHLDLTVAMVVLLVGFVHGTSAWRAVNRAVQAPMPGAASLRIAAVNPELPCIFTNNQAEWDEAYLRLSERTRMATTFPVDLVIWPETVFWDVLPEPKSEDLLSRYANSYKATLLLGCSDTLVADGSTPLPKTPANARLFRNAVWCFPPTAPASTNNIAVPAQKPRTYAKRHLIPFGEYIPLDKTFPFLQRFSPTGGSCIPGTAPVLFDIPIKDVSPDFPALDSVRVSPVICFEDTDPSTVRTAARSADFLVSLSNDAWFRGSGEALRHHAEARFRAIENGIPLIRVSNVGVTAVVYPNGLSTENASGGFLTLPIPLPPVTSSPHRTLYGVVGDWLFGIPCCVLFLAVLLWPRRRRHAAA